jgi:RimJ/RimL family protein N-acetyltransferase
MMQQTTVSGSELVSPQRIPSHTVTGEAPIRTPALHEASSSDPANFSPSVAHQLSGLIVNHWYACLAANEIRPDAPLDILDFSPGSGRSTLLMVRALQRKISNEGGFRWRYLPVVTDRKDIEKLLSLEAMRTLIAEEKVVPLIPTGDTEETAFLFQKNGKRWQSANPVVTLLHDSFSHLHHRLLAIHYGKLMEYEKNINVLNGSDADGTENTEGSDCGSDQRKWVAADLRMFDHDLQDLLANYLAKFNSAPVPYPQGALELVDLISGNCRQGCLMITAAPGVSSETEMRLASFSYLTTIFQNRQPMPVNFHLLSHKLKKIQAATDCLNLQKDQVIQIALFNHFEANARLSSLMRDVEPGMFDHASALSQAMQSVNGDSAFEHRLTLLKLSAFDPGVLAAIHGPNFSKASKHPKFNHEGWRQALGQVWANYLPDPKTKRLHEQIALMAMHCGHWSLARRALQSGLQHDGPNATDLAQLAWCDARTGRLRKAADKVSEALALDPANALAREILQRVEQRLAGWQGVWRQPIEHAELPLVLEPLDASHAEAMLYQYRDPQIAIMTGLPAMTTLESIRQWIEEQLNEKNWAHFSIMHRDLGFVGYINLAVSEHAAFFCFWTGVDFQGRGLATQAGKLACEYARQAGVPVMLTSAYTDNQRSITALKRIGFIEIPIRALPPDHERIFYVLPTTTVPEIDSVAELRDYYRREKISLSFPDDETDQSNKILDGDL